MKKILGTVVALVGLTVLLPAGCLGAVVVAGGAITAATAATTCLAPAGAQPADPDRTAVATVIATVMRAEGWGDRGVQLALAVAWAESRLANATTGDGTSRGAFQQLEGYAGIDLAPDPTARWWGPWSGQHPAPGASPGDAFTDANAWGPDGWATHDRRMDVATATAMFSDAAKSTMQALGMGWRAWGSQPATESPARLIDLARAIQRFPATDTNYAAALTGPQSGEYATVLASALAAGTPDPASPGQPTGDLPRDGLLVFGDSLAQGYAAVAPARGFGGTIRTATHIGASTAEALADPAWMARLRDAPHRVLISLGTNGPVTGFADDARALLHAIPSTTQVWWPRVWGGTAATVNPALEALAATDPRLHIVDLGPSLATRLAGDGIHPTPDGYTAAWNYLSASLAGSDLEAIGSVNATVGCDPNALDPTAAVDPAMIPAPDPAAAIAVAAALTGVRSGGRYVVEGNGPIDFDCSGLTAWAWRHAGVALVDYSYTQREATTAIPRSAAQPGDLVFWFGGDAHHVAIITAVDGDQITIAEAANPTTGLAVRSLGGAWDDAHLSGFGRVTRAT
jgi:hypothetical protein